MAQVAQRRASGVRSEYAASDGCRSATLIVPDSALLKSRQDSKVRSGLATAWHQKLARAKRRTEPAEDRWRGLVTQHIDKVALVSAGSLGGYLCVRERLRAKHVACGIRDQRASPPSSVGRSLTLSQRPPLVRTLVVDCRRAALLGALGMKLQVRSLAFELERVELDIDDLGAEGWLDGPGDSQQIQVRPVAVDDPIGRVEKDDRLIESLESELNAMPNSRRTPRQSTGAAGALSCASTRAGAPSAAAEPSGVGSIRGFLAAVEELKQERGGGVDFDPEEIKIQPHDPFRQRTRS